VTDVERFIFVLVGFEICAGLSGIGVLAIGFRILHRTLNPAS